jgi:threonine aldolase
MDPENRQSKIDLRSDTVTFPTEEMRKAMYEAPLGDDVFGEDPTVNKLERISAEMLGKEAAVFVASGTMGNLAAILSHCGRGDEAILGDVSHIFLNEAGGISALGGINPRILPTQDDGTIDPGTIRSAIRWDDPHFPITRLICLENSHNRCGGAILSLEYVRQVASIAEENQLFLHLDGARIFNAAVGLNRPVADLAEPFDSVTFCLSKGLSAPVGSVLCGSEDFIRKARRARKILGGGMRQVGVIAAAGIVALESMVERLAEDHANARFLAVGLDRIPGIKVVKNPPPTNMVFISLDEESGYSLREFIARLREQGVLVSGGGPGRLRLVTHYGITEEDIGRTIEAFERMLN